MTGPLVDGGAIYNYQQAERAKLAQTYKAAADLGWVPIGAGEQRYPGSSLYPDTAVALACAQGSLFCLEGRWDRVYAIRTASEAWAPVELVRDANGVWSLPKA